MFYISITNPERSKESGLLFGMALFTVVVVFNSMYAVAILDCPSQGEKKTRKWIYMDGLFLVVVFWAYSLLLYLDHMGIEGFEGSDFMLNAGLPFLDFERHLGWDILVFFIMFLGYPVAFLWGVKIGKSRMDPKPAVQEPIKLDDDASIIVLADTHLGLRPSKFQDLLGRGSRWEPEILSTFLYWLKCLS